MPLFISFEGLDGSGKSTQARLLADELRRRGHTVVESYEPGGTPLGERLRELTLAPSSPAGLPLTTAFLVSASRAELIHRVIAPALKAGHVMIVDRYADSTVAYQSFGMGVPRDDVCDLTRIATSGLTPTITLFIDVSAGLGRQRLGERDAVDRLDAESTAFHERVRQGYRVLMEEDPARWRKIDGNASQDLVHMSVMREVQPLLRRAETLL
jgi:dTMP kinase